MDVYGHLYSELEEELATGLDALRAAALAGSSDGKVVSL